MKKYTAILLTLMLIVSSSVKMNIYAQEESEPKVESTSEEVDSETINLKTTDKNNEENLEENSLDESLVKEGKVNLKVIPSSEEVEVGNIIQYQIYFNLDGDVSNYTDVKVLIKISELMNNESIKFTQELEKLKIMGVTPIFDKASRVLTYSFPELDGGFETSLLLEFETMNGSALNNKVFNLEASIEAKEIETVTKEASVNLIAHQNASLSNKLNGIIVDEKLENKSSIRYLDEAVFGIGLSVNKFMNGSLALRRESKVSISYTLADGLEYISDTSGITPSKEGNTYTWLFDAQSNENEEYFFVRNFEITAKVVDDLTLFSTITNVSTANIEFIDGSSKEYTAKANVQISPNFGYELPELTNGSALATIFSGPNDNVGGVGWINNDDIAVTDGALLGWNLYLTPMGATNGKHGMNSYDVFFHPDENINIAKMYSGDFTYRPSSKYPTKVKMDDEVYYSLSVKYTDSEEWVRANATIRPSKYYSAEDLGIDPSRTVKTMWFHFHNNEINIFANDVDFTIGNNQNTVFALPAGLSTTNMRIWTTVEESYIGSVESNVGIAYSGWNDRVNPSRVDVQSKNVPEELRSEHYTTMGNNFESRIATKTAQIVSPPEGISRYVKGNAYFTQANKNLIEAGDNLLRIEIINDKASLRKLSGPFETYVLLGQGIKVKDLSTISGEQIDIIDDNFNNSGKTLLKVVFNTESITISAKQTELIPVVIEENSPYKIEVELFGYLNEDFHVSDVSNNNGTFTVKESDIYDLNKDGNISEEVFVTRNTYTYTNAYEYYGTLSASYDGINYSKTMPMHDGKEVKMNLSLHNTLNRPIKDLILIGVLPTIGDTEVLTDIERNSKFDVNLTGPIIMPEGYENFFEVFYSTSKEPRVTGVVDVNTKDELDKIKNPQLIDDEKWMKENEIRDFSEIRSYKIILKQGSKPIEDNELHFGLNVINGNHSLSGKETLENRMSYSTYAVGINDASAFETQALQFVFEHSPKYTMTAKDVIMKLADVERMKTNGTLEEFILEKANPLVLEDNKTVLKPNIAMKIVDKPDKFSEGNYELEFSFDDGILRTVRATTTSSLIVLADETPEPTPKPTPKPTPEPGQNLVDEKDQNSEIIDNESEKENSIQNLPNTGVPSEYFLLSLGFILFIVGFISKVWSGKRKV